MPINIAHWDKDDQQFAHDMIELTLKLMDRSKKPEHKLKEVQDLALELIDWFFPDGYTATAHNEVEGL